MDENFSFFFSSPQKSFQRVKFLAPLGKISQEISVLKSQWTRLAYQKLFPRVRWNSFSSFFSKFPRNLPKTRVKRLSKACARVSESLDAINDVQGNITSMLLVFNKIVVFQQQMLFFHYNLDFYMNECKES